MVKDAEAHAAEDETRRESVEARNHLDSLVYQVERDSGEWGDKVSTDTKGRLDAALERGKEALKGDDTGEINEARDELMQVRCAIAVTPWSRCTRVTTSSVLSRVLPPAP